MAKFWFISAPLHGHLDWGGFLKTAQALTRRGHDILWLSESPIAQTVQVSGLPFHHLRRTGWLWPPPPAPDLNSIPPAQAVMLRYQRALDTWMSENLVAEAVDCLLDTAHELGKPDVIVTDPFITAAALAAESLDIPLAVCGWPAQREMNDEYLFPVQKNLGNTSRERLARLTERFGLKGVNFSSGPTPSVVSPLLHVSYFNDYWYQADQENILPQTLFVGGVPTPPADAAPTWLTDIPAHLPLALVTLGSVFTGDLGFFAWAAQAVAQVRHIPIVVIGRNPLDPAKKAELKAALPPNTRLLNWVPFDHVLPRTRLMIHHGGMGTTHAAVIHGIPQITVPHAADQRGNARRVAQAKVGLNLTAHDVRHGALLEGAKALSADANVQANARQLATDFAALGGAETAANAIEKLIS